MVRLLTRVRESWPRRSRSTAIPLSIEASFGVALYPDTAHDVEELLQCADAAMYQGKRGTADVVVHYGRRRPTRPTWLAMQTRATACPRARRAGAALPAQGPTFRTARSAALEALVRWQHPERGLLPPVRFPARGGAFRVSSNH